MRASLPFRLSEAVADECQSPGPYPAGATLLAERVEQTARNAPQKKRFPVVSMAVRFGAVPRSGGAPAVPVSQPTVPEPTGPGRVMVAQLAPNEFLMMGASVAIDIRPAYGSGYTAAQYLRVEQGTYEDGVWKASSVTNGDISGRGLSLPPNGAMLKVRLTRY